MVDIVPASTGSPIVRISVWSDYVCPFCYLELPELDTLKHEMGEDLEVDWRAFELRPQPEPTLDPDGAYLHRVWNASVYPMAAERRMVLKLPPVQPRSRKALEAAEFARGRGRFDEVHRALFRAFFEEGRDIGDVAVLLDIGEAAGLDRAELEHFLTTGAHEDKVLADQDLARRLGIGGVPALLVQVDEQGYLLNGAQPHASIRAAVEHALRAHGST